MDRRLLTPPSSPAAWEHLAVGSLELMLDGIDLRQVRFDGVEVAQQVYVAVRDQAWNTLPGTVSERTLERSDDRIDVAFSCRHDVGGSVFEWTGRIRAEARGLVEYRAAGRALAPLTYARIGLNVVHGAETYRGRPYRRGLNDELEEGRLPVDVAPQRMKDGRELGIFPPFRSLWLSPRDGFRVDLLFDGDEFEMEDQRNYGDGSFKTYSTPLQRPGPFRLEPGQTLEQSVRIKVSGDRPARVAPRTQRIDVAIEGPTDAVLPPIGLGLAPDVDDLTSQDLDWLSRLRPHHIRAEVSAADPVDDVLHTIERAARQASALDARAWLEVRTDEQPPRDVASLIARVGRVAAPPELILLRVPSMEPLDDGMARDALNLSRSALQQAGVATRVGVAVDFLAELLTAPFDAEIVSTASFGICPSVHRADDMTMMENLADLDIQVASARTALKGGRLIVGPVTLAARHGPYPDGTTRADGSPAWVDPRQSTAFAAAWTVGCLAGIAAGGGETVSLYQAKGPAGVIAAGDGGPYPVFQVLALAAEMAGAPLLHTTSVSEVSVLGWARDGARHVLLASNRPWPLEVRLSGIAAKDRSVLTGTGTTVQAWQDRDRNANLTLEPYQVISIRAHEENAH